MVVVSRYSAGGDEADIFKNKLGITDLKELQDAETVLLTDAYDHYLELFESGKLMIKFDLLFELHEYFLGKLYTWAGKIRTVNISKNDAVFASAKHLENALKIFKSDFEKNKPYLGDSKQDLARKLAFIHCELNVIHPFREGNGRTLRLFLDLLAVDAGYNIMDFAEVSHEKYIDACQKGMIQDYVAMEKIYFKLLHKTIK